MQRPRWHDRVLTGGVVVVFLVGVWVLWGEDIRGALGWKSGKRSEPAIVEAPASPGAT